MSFNSIPFLIFFPAITLLFYVLPHKYRWILLLAGSCIFYMSFIPQYILILFTTIVVDYWGALKMEKSSPKNRKKYLVLSIVITCLVLFLFKYFDFFNETTTLICAQIGVPYRVHNLNWVLPIGLSFHTFQSLSYVVEVYRGNQKAERHFGIYSLYVMFYPQLVAGPIERPQNLLTQLREYKVFKTSNISEGSRLILFGFFAKMVVADNLAPYVDEIYANPTLYKQTSVLTGLFFYSFQIYFDFFGYTTIALGCAKLLGYNLMDNFNKPYLAKNLSDFWERWHISLSTWFRDYIYFPLGGNKVSVAKWISNIFIVFLLSGLWHGANLTFLLWGFFHALIFVLERFLKTKLNILNSKNAWITILHALAILKNFVLASFLWIFFRGTDLANIKQIFNRIFNNTLQQDSFQIDTKVWFFLISFILFDVFVLNKRFDFWCADQPVLVRWSVYAVMLFSVMVFSGVQNYPFIYFQF
ncbi:MBOAT family O-acyltransferase [Pedobacter arcticus]|uniref:MBOAT family O-acyltransferase n=1 Tax=Pedobacter arcticus TaxID=752140 RepID=UPI0004745764|nr:MBOAT family O-acyltransferase [Pedobacter arcticus]